MESPSLDDRIQEIAPELQNLILEQVLLDFEPEQVIDKDYKPPSQLQLNRDHRKEFAKRYYGLATFKLEYDPYSLIMEWPKSLPADHRQLIEKVEFRIAYLWQKPIHWTSGYDELVLLGQQILREIYGMTRVTVIAFYQGTEPLPGKKPI